MQVDFITFIIMNGLKTKVVNNLGLTISDFAPYFSFDKQTKLISLYTPR
jgi:hypothetical protein